MSQAMLSGASGLIAHQRKLDVVANNLANLNTTAFKSQRVLFSDLMYATVRPAGGGDGFAVGGTNPLQTGYGVGIAHTSRDHNQGVLTATGGMFDFAIDGPGFFVLSNGTTQYSRSGAFSLDSRGYLVEPATGALVQRFGIVGEGGNGNPPFQVAGNSAIRVPLGAAIPGSLTTKAMFNGNLPAAGSPPVAEVLSSLRAFMSGGSPATTATLLNDLDSNQTPYVAGDQLQLDGFDFHGNPISATLAVDDTTTLGDLVDFYNSVLVDAVAELDAEGNLVIRADQAGDSQHQLELSDASGNTGQTQLSNHSLVEEVEGKDGDAFETTMQVFDTRGQARSLNVKFQKADFNSWDVEIDLVDSDGTIVDGVVRGVEFSEDGNFLTVRGLGTDDSAIEIQFDSLATSQRIDLDFSQFTHLARDFMTTVDQDGYPPGNLVAAGITGNGVLEGIATNGKRVPIAQLAIANFANPQGLEAVGHNSFRESVNSGSPQNGASQSGNNGIVRNGQLESSNVDVALEFTQMIVAQRGFSANARSITVASEVLQELVNLLR